jgi:hypothetical protein
MKRIIIIAMWMISTVAMADYVATFGTVAVTNNLRVTNNITAGGSIIGRDMTATNTLVVYGESYFTRPMYGGALWLTNWLRVDSSVSLYSSVDFYGIPLMRSAMDIDGTLRAHGSIYMDSWTNLAINFGAETLPAYLTNFVASATNISGYVSTNDARYLAALTNESDTLATVLSRGTNASGKSAIGFLDVSGSGRLAFGTGLTSGGMDTTANGAQQSGRKTGGTLSIGATSYGARQNLYVDDGVVSIGTAAYGAEQSGYSSGTIKIGDSAIGASQRGNVSHYLALATNAGTGAVQLFDLSSEQTATTTEDGDGSILLGAGTASNRYAVVAGDGQVSHGDGSITAGGGFFGSGSSLTGITAAQVGAVATNDARYLAAVTNSAWLWSGAQIVPAATSAYSIAYGGPAVWNAGSNRFDVLPYSTTNYGAITGTVTITMASNAYLSSIGGDWYIKTVSGTTPQQPVTYNLTYATSTSAVLSAWCSTNPADATSDYYAYFSNLVVYTYDRTGMTPYQYTNDAAGIVARVDPLPTGNTDTRRVVNSESLAAAIAAAKPDIAKEAWAYMPSGARQPSYNAVTLDKPLIQQSAGVIFMQSGDYFAQSYIGTWDATVTGSVWRVGPSGLTALEIASTNINLAITSFTVRTNVATFVIATNGIVGTPYIEQTADLTAPQWLYVAGQTITNTTTNWTATCSTVATMRFFRAVSPGGANKITSAYSHVFNAGISDGTTAMPSRSLYVVTNANGSGCTITGFFSVTP